MSIKYQENCSSGMQIFRQRTTWALCCALHCAPIAEVKPLRLRLAKRPTRGYAVLRIPPRLCRRA